MTDKKQLYWDFIQSEAWRYDTDGCSHVSNLDVGCCYEHDLAYRTHKDPRSAYRAYLAGLADWWAAAASIDRRTADARFRTCIQSRHLLGRYTPIAWWRWVGVRLRGGKAWNNYVEAVS